MTARKQNTYAKIQTETRK